MAWYRTGGGGLPSSLVTDMNAVLNKKMGTSTVYPSSEWADTINLMGKLPEANVGGAIANFQDGADEVPLKNLVANIPATEIGVSQIEITHTGTNILNGEFETGWINNDGTITPISGRIVTKNYSPCVGSTSYYFTFGANWRVAWYDESKTVISATGTYNSDRAITSPENARYVKAALPVTSTEWACINYPNSKTSHEQYQGENIIVPLGRTIYGGIADVVTGEGEDENGNSFSFEPVTVNSLLGTNTIWNNLGNTTVTYRRDIELALANNAPMLMMSRPPIQEEESTDESI